MSWHFPPPCSIQPDGTETCFVANRDHGRRVKSLPNREEMSKDAHSRAAGFQYTHGSSRTWFKSDLEVRVTYAAVVLGCLKGIHNFVKENVCSYDTHRTRYGYINLPYIKSHIYFAFSVQCFLFKVSYFFYLCLRCHVLY